MATAHSLDPLNPRVLEPTPSTVGAVLVIGGGIGGVQAALDLADSGYKVYLVEQSSAIGGVMAMLDKTFPTNDCSMCILSPKLVAAGRHRNIELMTLTDVLGVEGEPGHMTARLRNRARYVDLAECTGCGDCLQKCPVKLPNEFEGGLSQRKAIYRLYAQAVPNAPMIDRDNCLKLTKDKCGACAKNCRVGAIDYSQQDEEIEVRVGSVVVAAGSKIAPTRLRSEYGHGRYPNVVTSLQFERILSASGPYLGHIKRPADGKEPKKVAWLQCVGSRDESIEKGYCSAMCCMYAVKEAVIAKEHTPRIEPTVFYMDMRSYGKDFDRYVERAEERYGVRLVRARVPEVREDPETHDLIMRYATEDGMHAELFDMVVLSCGLVPPQQLVELSRRLEMDLDRFGFAAGNLWDPTGSSRPGFSVAGSFHAPMAIPETVTEASGAAASAGGMLAEARGTMAAELEPAAETDVRGEPPRVGAFICHCGVNIGGVVDVPAVVEYARTQPFVAHAEENLYSCSGDTQQKIKDTIRQHRLNRVMVASCSPRTHEPLFQATLAEAGLNPHLFAMANIRDQCSWVHAAEKGKATEKAKELVRGAIARVVRQAPLPRVKLSVTKSALVVGGGIAGMSAALSIADQGFEVSLVERESELGGNARQIWRSAEGEDIQARLTEMVGRVSSHPRIDVHTGATIEKIDGFVGNYRTKVKAEAERQTSTPDLQIEHGVVVVATGAEYRTPTEYCYGGSERIITQRELEELIAHRSDAAKEAESVVMIQCVGSRESERPWCSRVCCTEAVKNAVALKELDPNLDVFVLYRDIRTYGLREEYYRRARELGVVFIRYASAASPGASDPDSTPEVKIEDGKPVVTVRDKVIDREIRFRPGLLVLSSGIVPRPDASELAKMLKVPLNADGFFLEAHMKLRPVDFATEGVFMAGLAQFPKFIDESVAQARAAAGRAATVLSREFLESEVTVAHVDPQRCAACRMCETLCAYHAIEVRVVDENSGQEAAVVNEALCKGCGACAANCRCSAIDVRGVTNEGIFREIAALLT
ncbi:MAG: CoB--CoM heterodisulfide reductase iron-sulfur subunit A family protein [candidate division WOR-3 bacterium]|nr:MAG: CoB--CoM heterodisulfide reductase iron-sulfur subunit A family protein [candidate division WOR-3 bacterium]